MHTTSEVDDRYVFELLRKPRTAGIGTAGMARGWRG